MAIDHSIALGVQTPDAINPILRGFQGGQQIRNAPMQNKLLQAGLESQQLQNQAAQQGLQNNRAKMSEQERLRAGQALARAYHGVKPQLEADDTVGALKALGREYDAVSDSPVAASAIQGARQAIGSGDQAAIARVMRDGEVIARQFPVTQGQMTAYQRESLRLQGERLANQDRLFVTGKWWPKLFEIKLVKP